MEPAVEYDYGQTRQIEVVQMPDGSGDTWSVELIDYADEGRCYITAFYGPRSEERARAYAAWLNTQ